jgi:dynein heavy chain
VEKQRKENENAVIWPLWTIVRTLGLEHGHSPLLGSKSSGRKSQPKLGLYVVNAERCQMSLTRYYGLTEWREDLKNLLRQCEIRDGLTGLVIHDEQILFPQQIEDTCIANLMCDGEIH